MENKSFNRYIAAAENIITTTMGLSAAGLFLLPASLQTISSGWAINWCAICFFLSIITGYLGMSASTQQLRKDAKEGNEHGLNQYNNSPWAVWFFASHIILLLLALSCLLVAILFFVKPEKSEVQTTALVCEKSCHQKADGNNVETDKVLKLLITHEVLHENQADTNKTTQRTLQQQEQHEPVDEVRAKQSPPKETPELH